MLVLDINDGNIVLSRGDEVLHDEPGLALVEEKAIAFGYDASARSRLHPRGLHDQFWQKMNADPLSSPGGGARNHADLVYLHLRSILADIDPGEDTVVVAPSSTTPEQLSLFLGIAEEAGLNVRAIVDGSVAAAAPVATMGADAQHVDFTLHRGIVTALRVGDMLEKAHATEVPEAGLRHLIEGWVDVIADRFIDETRFDPLRIAATEQQVFDQIVAKMRSGRMGGMTVEVEHDGERRRVDVSEAALAHKLDQRIGLLANAVGDAPNLVLSHRAAMVPGLDKKLTERGHHPTLRDAADTRRSIAQHAERILGDAGSVKLVTSLPVSTTPPTDPKSNETDGRTGRATGLNEKRHEHQTKAALLCRGIAVEIGDGFDSATHPANENPRASFRIEVNGRIPRIASTADGLLLNGEPVADDRALHVGDTLRIGDETFQFIRVLVAPGEGHGQG